MDLFKGYIESVGKVPIHKIKDGVWLSEPPETADYVGVLRDDIIQLDFDDSSEAETVLKIVDEYKLRCDILKTTRGVHLYFLRDDSVSSQSVGIFNAIGLHCDIGLGNKNRVIPLRITREVPTTRVVSGEKITTKETKTIEREWLQTYPDLESLPSFFRPIGKIDYRLKTSNTRNQTLFNYILVLQSMAFTKAEIRKTIKIINNYILYEPLPDREIDIITRDEAFSEELFFDGKKFLHDKFGNYMLANSNIIHVDGQMLIYTRDRVYSNDPDEFERVMIEKIPFLKDTQRKEVYKYVSLKCTNKGEFAPPKYIATKYTILDLETMEEFPYSPKWIINNKVDVEYDQDAYCEVTDKMLDRISCGDQDIRKLIEEMIGYTLYRKNSMQKCFILTGGGSNGKSTLLNAIKRLLGKQNYTSLDLRELEETFTPAELYNKLANIGDDISAKYLDNSSVFKKVVTGESFIVQKKYAQPFELESYATQIFCANELPQVNDKSDGFSRRIIIVPFRAKFKRTDKDYDPFIEDKILSEESLKYLLRLGIDGLRNVIINKEFTVSVEGEKEKDDYIKLNNNVLEWFEDDPKIENEAVSDVYLKYKVWCVENGCHPVKKHNLTKEIGKAFKLTSTPVYNSVEKKTIRMYVKEEK